MQPLLIYSAQVDEIWDSMCQGSIGLISKALHQIDNAENLLKVKNLVALFIQTMQVRYELGLWQTVLLIRSLTELELSSDGFQWVPSDSV